MRANRSLDQSVTVAADQNVLISDCDGVLRMTLNRPKKLNAITPEMIVVVQEAVWSLRDRDDLRVMIVDARGRYFSSGMDVTLSPEWDEQLPTHVRRRYRELHLLWDEFETVEKPIILAAQGPCLGGALEMALSCDFRIVSEECHFSLPEIHRGVLPGSGGVSRLTRLVGVGWARWLAMAGQIVGAEQALSIGLVHEVVPVPDLATRVDELAAQLMEPPQEAVALAKLAIDAVGSTDRSTGRDIERIANASLQMSDEFRARKAVFKARHSNRSDAGSKAE